MKYVAAKGSLCDGVMTVTEIIEIKQPGKINRIPFLAVTYNKTRGRKATD